MRNTLKIECFVQALENYMDAKRDHDTARDEYHDTARDEYRVYSWGYHGDYYIRRMEDAAEEFQKTIDNYIEEKVRAIIGE